MKKKPVILVSKKLAMPAMPSWYCLKYEVLNESLNERIVPRMKIINTVKINILV